MSQPSVNIDQLDGSIGVLPASAGKIFAVVGVSSSGALNTPATYARVSDLTGAKGDGPMVEGAAAMLQKYGRPVVTVRADAATNVGDYGTPVDAVTGTSVVSTTVGSEPNDEYDFVFEVVTGGTIGTAGITFRFSFDGGSNFSPVTALGTATDYDFGLGVSLDFAAGTLIAGDTWSVRTVAPEPTSAELLTALNALGASAVNWGVVYITGAIDATLAGVIETWCAGLATSHKYRAYICNTRTPNSGETEAAYLAALDADFTAFGTTYGMVCAGDAKIISSVSGRNYRRPVAHSVAAKAASVSEEINIAAIDQGPLAGVRVTDANGNPQNHDESINPGLDDARFTVLRTWDLEPGVYVNRPRIFSSAGSDFQLFPHRLIMNIALEVVDQYFRRRLNKPIRVNATTGFILEADAAEIESGARAALAGALLARPKASAVSVAVSRTDNILSTKTLTGSVSVVPLAYPETISLEVGFANPVLAAVTA